MRTIRVEPYGWVLTICLGEAEANRWRKKNWPDKPDDEEPARAAIGYLDYHDEAPRDKRWLMMLQPKLCYLLLAHESLHCAVWMMQESGQLADFDTQEGLAYSQGHIMEQILKRCWPAEYRRAMARQSAAIKLAHKEAI